MIMENKFAFVMTNALFPISVFWSIKLLNSLPNTYFIPIRTASNLVKCDDEDTNSKPPRGKDKSI